MHQARKSFFSARSTTTLVILLVASLLTACTKPSPTHQPEQIVITFGCLSDQVTAYRTLADQFQAIHPGTHVHIREIDDVFESMDPSSPALTLKALATQADTFIWYNVGLDQAARLGLLLDLQPLLEESSESDFSPGPLDAFHYKDTLWGLPAYADPLVMFYDQTAFDQLGITYPKAGWHWDDFATVAQRLTLQESDGVIRYGFVDTDSSFPLALVYQHDGVLLRREAESVLMTPFLENSQAVEALAWYGALATEQSLMPGLIERDAADASALVTAGRAAMWTATLSSMEVWLASGELSSIGVAPLPEDVSAAHPLLVSGYAVSAGTPHPQAAWRWIEYLTRQPAPSMMGHNVVPARRSLAEAQCYWASLGDAAPAVRYALSHALVEPGLWELWPAVRPLGPLVRGEMTADTFVTKARQRAEIWQADRAVIESRPIVVATPPLRTQEEQKKIVFGVQSSTQQAHYERLAQVFKSDHPDIQVEVEDVTAGHTFVDLDLMADNADIFVWSDVPFVDSDEPAVLDLTPLIQADRGFSTEDYVSWLLLSEKDGRTWGLPVSLDTQVIYYDKAAFDKAGIVYPDPGWTWDDLLSYAMQLTVDDESGKRYGFLSWVWLPWNVYVYVESHGVHLMEQQDGETVYNFDSDAVKRAVQWWSDLDRVYAITPPLEDKPSQRDYNLMQARRAAMWSDWASNRDATWLYEADRQLGVLPMPRGERSAALVNVQFAYISSRAEQPEACWQWMRYLSQHLPPGYLAPVRTSLLNSPTFKHQVGTDMAVAYREALQADVRLGLGDGRGEGPFLAWLQEALVKVSRGENANTVMEEVQQKALGFGQGVGP
jgi:ABC-type glycerol-3-phosphate transport system substrate-binding protein